MWQSEAGGRGGLAAEHQRLPVSGEACAAGFSEIHFHRTA
jgi:hypothetical protein